MAGPGTITFDRTDAFSQKTSAAYADMRSKSMLTDLVISANDGAEMPCHKVIVAAMSGYIKKIVCSDMVECAKNSVKLPQFSALILALLIEYIYLGQMVFDVSQLMDILSAAHFLQIEEVVERCVCEVQDQLSPSNVLEWLHLGQELKLQRVETASRQFMHHNYAAVMMEKAFLRLSDSEVLQYLGALQGPGVQHDVLLGGAMRWVAHDAGGRAKHLHQLMKTLALQNCSLPALIQVMDQYGEVIGPNLPVLKMLTEAMKRLTVQHDPQKQAGKEEAKKTRDATTTDPQVTTGQTKPMLVIAGGIIGNNANSMCWGMTTPNQFSKLTQIPAHGLAKWHSVCATVGGFIVTGGLNSDMCSMFTAATMSWQGMRKLRSARHAHASICIRGMLRVIGGWMRGNWTESVECMELSENQWRDGPHLPKRVSYPKVAELSERVYLIDAVIGRLCELDVASSAWTERARIPRCDYTVSMASVKDKLAVMGGWDRICMLYDPTTDAWTQCEQPRHPHCFGALVYYGGRVLLMGGRADGNGSDAVESYNLDDGTWSAADITMPTENLCCHHALVLTTPHDD